MMAVICGSKLRDSVTDDLCMVLWSGCSCSLALFLYLWLFTRSSVSFEPRMKLLLKLLLNNRQTDSFHSIQSWKLPESRGRIDPSLESRPTAFSI